MALWGVGGGGGKGCGKGCSDWLAQLGAADLICAKAAAVLPSVAFTLPVNTMKLQKTRSHFCENGFDLLHLWKGLRDL